MSSPSSSSRLVRLLRLDLFSLFGGKCSGFQSLSLLGFLLARKESDSREAMSAGHDGEGEGGRPHLMAWGLHWFPWKCPWTWLVMRCPAESTAEVCSWENPWSDLAAGSEPPQRPAWAHCTPHWLHRFSVSWPQPPSPLASVTTCAGDT